MHIITVRTSNLLINYKTIMVDNIQMLRDFLMKFDLGPYLTLNENKNTKN